MPRIAHVIKQAKGNELPALVVWADTETKPERVSRTRIKHNLDFGWACCRRRMDDGRWTEPEWIRFTKREQFWQWVAGKNRPQTRLYLFCHNASFDMPVLDVFHQLPALGYKLTKAVVDGPPTILDYRKPKQDGSGVLASIKVVDTLNIWRMSLAELGDKIGLPKLNIKALKGSPDEADVYCRRDVEIMMQACLTWWQMLKDEDFGGFAPTLAGQALRTYRHRFMDQPIYIDVDKPSLNLTREAYHGGRCECFYIGRFSGPHYLLDVNSMYPYVMATQQYPYRLHAHTKHVKTSDLARWVKEWAVVARVDIETTEPFVGCWDGSKLYFPVGRFEATVCTPEIEYALKHAKIHSVKEAAVYERADLFSGFVLDIYERRKAAIAAGEKTTAGHLKIMMNSLYGKFGQTGEHYEEIGEVDSLEAFSWVDIDHSTGEIKRFRQLGGLVQCCSTETEARESFPAIAAHVTAYARMLLYSHICRAGVENTLYVDTDSLLVNKAGYVNLKPYIDALQLGGLKLELQCRVGEIWGPKDYRFGKKEKHKGVRRKAKWLTPNRVRQEKWSGLRGLIGSKVLNETYTDLIEKNLKRVYDKGVRGVDGRVTPLVLP